MAISCCWPARKSSRPTRNAAKKTVVLAIDRSGSMSGQKIEQAKGAAKFVIEQFARRRLVQPRRLRRPGGKLAAGTAKVQRRQLAKPPWALSKAFTPAAARTSTARSPRRSGNCTMPVGRAIVIFLTDGIPTVGETNEAKIVANAKSNNTRARTDFRFRRRLRRKQPAAWTSWPARILG